MPPNRHIQPPWYYVTFRGRRTIPDRYGGGLKTLFNIPLETRIAEGKGEVTRGGIYYKFKPGEGCFVKADNWGKEGEVLTDIKKQATHKGYTELRAEEKEAAAEAAVDAAIAEARAIVLDEVGMRPAGQRRAAK